VGLLGLCRKFLFSELECEVFAALRDSIDLVREIAGLGTEDFLRLARELEFLGALPRLLGPWCLSGGRAMAAPVAALLGAGGNLTEIVMNSSGVLAFIASLDFLGAWEPLGPGEHLIRVAQAGGLEALRRCKNWSWLRGPADVECLFEHELLFPLLQIPGLRQELRQIHFCDAGLGKALEPFPILFDELVGAWHLARPRPGMSPCVQHILPPSELAAWTSCGRFLDQGLLGAQLEVAGSEETLAFANAAPLQEPVVAGAVADRIKSLANEACSGLPPWSQTSATIVTNANLVRMLWPHRAVGRHALLRLLAAVAIPLALAPLRITILLGRHPIATAVGVLTLTTLALVSRSRPHLATALMVLFASDPRCRDVLSRSRLVDLVAAEVRCAGLTVAAICRVGGLVASDALVGASSALR